MQSYEIVSWQQNIMQYNTYVCDQTRVGVHPDTIYNNDKKK